MSSRRIRRVLIANRGEIALRVIRACQELDIETVAVFSEADRDSAPVRMADRSVCIGAAAARESYLDPKRILGAAVALKVDAIHPGYGFLSENAAFAELVGREGIIFVGPSPQAIRSMGDKAMARRLAREAGVPTTPGSEGILNDASHAMRLAEQMGYPVLLKASAGGGGRGMRVVHSPDQIESAFHEASREARAAFGDGAMYLEKFMTSIRHIEIQVLGDGESVLHLGERDCSTQRRNQKLVEESPSPILDPKLREAIGEAAVRLCRHVGYTSAGTVECMLDPASDEFYFMEMNTRIQVEHPVTEMVSGLDLVKAQLRIADGEGLPMRQQDVRLHGHAIECRINAEDPERDFAPSPGVIRSFSPPGGAGVRVDSHLFSGYRVPPHYDSLLAKVICWGVDRAEAIARMRRALDELVIDGVATTSGFHRRLLASEDFRAGRVHTRFVQDELLPRWAAARESTS
jgi:acetyl-CoA carboxylase biotin carboxylase subunit